MSKGLLYSTRATTGREGKYVSRHMCILQTQSDIIDHLNSNTGQQTKKNIEKFADISIRESKNLYGDFYMDKGRHMTSWAEVYDNLDVTPLKEYNNLYLMAGIDLHTSGMTRWGNRVNIFPQDRGQLKFISHGKIFVNILAMLKAHKEYDIPFHEYQYDTGEMSLTLFHENYRPHPELYASYYNHEVPEYNIRRMDSLQYYLQNMNKKILCESEKNLDFTFAYSVLKTSGRSEYPRFVNDLAKQFQKSSVFTKNHFTGEDTSIDSDLYTDMITRTRFTLILPAYDRRSFAIDRFITSLNANCLPLLHSDTDRSMVEKSYNVCLDDLVICDPNNLTKFTEKSRIELLEFYKDKFLKVEKGLVDFRK